MAILSGFKNKASETTKDILDKTLADKKEDMLQDALIFGEPLLLILGILWWFGR